VVENKSTKKLNDDNTPGTKKRVGLFGRRSRATGEQPSGIDEVPAVETSVPAIESRATTESRDASDVSAPVAPRKRGSALTRTKPVEKRTKPVETRIEPVELPPTGLAPASLDSALTHPVSAEASGGGAVQLGGEPAHPASGKTPSQTPIIPEFLTHLTTTSLVFHAPPTLAPLPEATVPSESGENPETSTVTRRRTRRRSTEPSTEPTGDERTQTTVRVRTPRPIDQITEPQRVKGSTRLEAKKQRRRDGRDSGRRRTVVTESEFQARRDSVNRAMVVRDRGGRIQIGVLEDDVLVEHYVARNQEASLIGNVYLGRVQNVLPSMEAAFVDIGKGRNAVLYSGEVDWDAAAEVGEKNQPRKIEVALKPGDKVLVQVTKDPVGHKGARLTSQVSLPGRYLVYVPNGAVSGISRKLPDTERARLKKVLKESLPENVGVIVRTAAEGASEEQLTYDVTRLVSQWDEISAQLERAQAPALLHSEPDLLIKIIRDIFNEDFHRLVVEGDQARATIEKYLEAVAPDLVSRVERYSGEHDSFDEFRVSEQIDKALERKVWLPSGGSLVIDRTEAMTVVDVNTGKFVGSGGNLEETVTRNNLEAAEEIVRQLRLRDIGGIIVVDFIDMVLETNRDLVLRRLIECLSRDRTKHQVAEVTSLGLVQMTRKKLGLGLLESFSEACEVCAGRGVRIQTEPINKGRSAQVAERRRVGVGSSGPTAMTRDVKQGNGTYAITADAKNALAQIAASTIATASNSEKDVPSEAASGGTAVPEPSTNDTSRSGSRRRRAGGGRAQLDATGEISVSVSSAVPVLDSAPELPVPISGSAQISEPVPVSDSAPELPVPISGSAQTSEPVPVLDRASLLPPIVAVAPARPPLDSAEAARVLDSVLESLPVGPVKRSRRRVSTGSVPGTGAVPVITAPGD